MKEKKLFDAITDIDDKLIDEARVIPKKKRLYARLLIPLAACLAVVIGVMLFSNNNALKFEDALMDVVFPKAFAFNDLDSRVKLYKDNPVEESFFEAVNNFSYKTASALLSDSDDNTTYSPVSMYYALALAATGANGETQSEMLNLLGVSDSETLSTQSRYLYNRLYRDNDIIKSRINNSLWLNRAEDFNKDFIENAAENFYAHSFNM
ncbi:MAG: serpin family protein, partial [Clostridia bacterium]|nr:serpin family protein [Clostridia bacterium]